MSYRPIEIDRKNISIMGVNLSSTVCQLNKIIRV